MRAAIDLGRGEDMGSLEMGYALSKQVPAMRESGFEIGTAYGPIHVLPSALANRIAALIEAHLQLELTMALHRAECNPEGQSGAPV